MIRLSLAPKNHKQWLASRSAGIGGSEVAAIMGLNPYQCALEVFRRKVGLLPLEDEDTVETYMGHLLEPIVADLWQYWDGTPESVIQNRAKGRKKRHCEVVKYRVQNSEFPHLIGHLDRVICSGPHDIGNPENAVLEIKTISGFVANQWEEGIPAYHLSQLQTYLAVTGLKYGEVAMLVDGRELQVYRFERDEGMISQIVHKTGEFWDKVELARMVWADPRLPEGEKERITRDLEPKPDASPAWEKFLKEQYRGNPDLPKVLGDDQLLEAAREYENAHNLVKDAEEQKTYWSNQIRYMMGDYEEVVFPGNGKITYKTRGKSRTLSIKLKHFEFA